MRQHAVCAAVGCSAVLIAGFVLSASLTGCRPARESPAASKLSTAATPPSSDKVRRERRNWHMFGGSPARTMANTVEKNIPAEWEVPNPRKGTPGRNIKWVAELGTQSYGNPVVYDGKLFLGTNNGGLRNPRDIDRRFPPEPGEKPVPEDKGIVMCFNEADGKFLWQAVHDKLPAGRVNDWPDQGVCSSPFVEGNRLYYVSNRCELVCADVNGLRDGNQGKEDEKYKDATDADFIWRLDMIKELGVFPHNLAVCSPLVIGDYIYIVTGNGHDESHENIPVPRAPSFLCVHKETGEVVWKSNLPGENILHGQWSNPAYVEVDGKGQVLFPGGDGWLYSFEPKEGKLLWKFDCNPKDSVWRLGGGGTRNYIIATPVVYEQKVYLPVGQDPEHGNGVGHLWCIDVVKATRFGGDVSPELIVDAQAEPIKTKANPNSALAWHFGGLDKDGKIVFHRTISTCAVHDGLCYAASLYGAVVCLDARTGEKYWEIDTRSAIWGSPTYIDGKIYIGTEEGDVFVFKAGKEGNRTDDGRSEPVVLAKIEHHNPVYSTPIAVNGVLYVMTRSHLYAIEAKK